MDRPILSPNFTIEDIHKLREYDYYQPKDRLHRNVWIITRGMEVHREIQYRKIQKV